MGCNNSNQAVLINQINLLKDHIKGLQNKFSNQMTLINQMKTLQSKLSSQNNNETLILNQIRNLQEKFENVSSKDSFYRANGKAKGSEISMIQESKINLYEAFIKRIKQGEIRIFQEQVTGENRCQGKSKKGLALSQELQDLIKSYYEKLIDQKLQALNQGKLLSTEFKNHLSWYIVHLNLAIIQRIINDPQFQYAGNNFKSLQQFQRQFLGFLKKKYPRGDNLDAGQLSNEFKELIDFTDQYENDILTNAGFFFDSEDGFQIIQTLKLFINKLIDETNKHYSAFQKFMKENIFQTAEKDSFVIGRKIPQNVSKYKRIDKNSLEIHSNEIFRILVKWIDDLEETVKNPKEKIPSNSQWSFVRKYKPKPVFEEFKEQQQYTNWFKPQLIKCAKYYRQMLIQQGLYQKIQQLHNQKKISNKQNEIQRFNTNVIKNFNQVQKYSPLHLSRQQAQIIKFCEFSMKFYKHNVEQKLIQLIKTLVKAASVINQKIQYGNQVKSRQNSQVILNLIKFKISDLLRCKFQGNKEEIIRIKRRFQKLQSQNKIKIIKVKNRFNTDLSDAMIIFKIILQNKKQDQAGKEQTTIQKNQQTENNENKQNKQNQFKQKKQDQKQQCYLICQCQLILTQKSKSSNKKLKNIQTLNHYLYELQRSPFKVLGQSILQLNYKYDIIKYSNKIKVGQLKNNLSFCQHQKLGTIKQLQIKYQNFPMICWKCWVFYGAFQNNSTIKECSKCYKYICYKCNQKQKQQIKQNKPSNNKLLNHLNSQRKIQTSKQISQTILQRYLEHFCLLIYNKKQQLKLQINFLCDQDRKKYKELKQSKQMSQMLLKTRDYLNKYFYQPRFNLKDQFSFKDQIKVKQLILFLYKEYHQMNYEGTIERIFFIIMSFSKNRVIMRGYKYQAHDQKLFNIQNQQQSYEGHQLFQLNEHDTLFYTRNYQSTTIPFYTKRYLFKKFIQITAQKNQKLHYGQSKIQGVLDKHLRSFNIIFDMFKRNDKKPTLEDFQQSLIRKKLVYMSKGLEDKDYNQLKIEVIKKQTFRTKKHFKQLKLINLQGNKIVNIQGILQDCKQLQILILNKNQIKQIKLDNSLDSLQILELMDNKIVQILGLQNLKCLKILNLQKNQLKKIFAVKQNEVNQNKIDNKKYFYNFPFLISLNVSQNQLGQIFNINAPNIQEINLRSNYLKEINQFLSNLYKNLKFLYLHFNSIKQIRKLGQEGQTLKLQKIYLGRNILSDINQFLSNSFSNLIQLSLYDNKLNKLQRIKGDNLKIQIINIQQNKLQDITQFLSSSFSNLKQLGLYGNKINKIGKIGGGQNLKIQKINLQYNQLQDITQFLSSSFSNLRQLSLKNNKINKIGRMGGGQNLKIQKIDFQWNKLQDVTQFISSSFSNLKSLIFLDNKIKKIGRMGGGQNLKVQKIDLRNNQLQDVTEFWSSSFSNLKQITFQNNKINKIGKMGGGQNLKIQKIVFAYNQLQDITQFLSSSFSNLIYLSLSSNKINKLGKLGGGKNLKIQKIKLDNNEIQDVSEFLDSPFTNLKQLQLQGNKIKNIGKIGKGYNLKIQKLNLRSNQLQDIDDFLDSSFENLQRLQLDYNKLSKIIPPNKQFSNLKQISIINNKLTQIPNFNAPQLQKLNLALNDFVTLKKQEIQRYTNLKQLNINYNKNLLKLPILNHLKLRILNMEQSNIENFGQFFKSNLPEVIVIRLENSKNLTQLPNIQNFTKLQYFYLQKCPISNTSILTSIQKQTNRYYKLKQFRLSLRVQNQSQQQFSKQKLKLNQILGLSLQSLYITKFQQVKENKKQQEKV